MPNPGESILALFAGPDRAAAIYGDLAEMAASRGHRWFVAAYLRTLISLGWRTPVAFLIAVASVRIMCLVYPWWVHHQLRRLVSEKEVGMFLGQLAVACSPFLNALAMCLWFALPFAWVRFGLQDRLTQFACVLFLCTFPVFSFQTWLIDASSILTMLTLLTALLSARWRRPLAVLASTIATAIAAVYSSFGLITLLAVNEHRPLRSFSMFKGVGWLTTALALALTAFVCSLLHHRLLRDRPTIA